VSGEQWGVTVFGYGVLSGGGPFVSCMAAEIRPSHQGRATSGRTVAEPNCHVVTWPTSVWTKVNIGPKKDDRSAVLLIASMRCVVWPRTLFPFRAAGKTISIKKRHKSSQ